MRVDGNERLVEVVAQFDGVIVEVRHLRPQREYSIPRGLVCEDGGAEAFALVRAGEHETELAITAQMSGELVDGERTQAIADAGEPSGERGVRRVRLVDGMRARVRLGALTFHLSFVDAPDQVPAGPLVDWRAHAHTATAALAAALALALLSAIPPDPQSLSLDSWMVRQRYPTFILAPPTEEAAPGRGPGAGAQAAAGRSGLVGKTHPLVRRTLDRPAGSPRALDRTLARAAAASQAQNAGVIGVLRANATSSIGAMWAPASALGDAAGAMDGLVGTGEVEAWGHDGLGLVDARGDGGGGSGKTIGLSTLPTRGGSGGYGWTGGIGGLHDKKREVVVDAFPNDARVVGGLDREIVRRVVRRHLNEVRFCYEMALMKRRDLYGRVAVEFTIAASGQVLASTVASSTVPEASVGSCIAEAARRWEFPRFERGVVQVTYPFIVKVAGD